MYVHMRACVHVQICASFSDEVFLATSVAISNDTHTIHQIMGARVLAIPLSPGFVASEPRFEGAVVQVDGSSFDCFRGLQSGPSGQGLVSDVEVAKPVALTIEQF